MNAVTACGLDSSTSRARSWAGIAAAALLGCATSAAWALDDEAAAAPERRSQLEVSASSTPRFDFDGSTRSSRVDMTWAPSQSALGVSLGMTSTDAPGTVAFGPRTDPKLDLGLRWRHTLDSNYHVDVIAWRRIMPADALTMVQTRQPSYGARVEMPMSPSAKSGLVADRGFVGLQLEGGARVSVRRTFGAPMLYYRNKF